MTEFDRLWYQKEDVHKQAESMSNTARALWSDQGESRRRLADDAMTLWSGSTSHALMGSSPLSTLGLADQLAAAGYNVVQAIVDTKVNDTLRNEIRPLFVTEGGDSELREKVAAMQEACDGMSYTLGLEDELEEQACWNGYIFGNGGQEFWSDTASSRVMVTPAWFWEYFVSRQEARNGNPQQCFSRHVLPRDVLLSFLAEAGSDVLDAVRSAPSASWEDAKAYDASEPGKVADLVVVFKAWHLPSKRVDLSEPAAFGKKKGGEKGKANHDGLHMVTLDWGGGKDVPPLLVRPWPYDHFPVAWFKPNRVPGSYWGRGEPEVLAATQIEANQWNERMYNILDRYARPAVVLPKGAKLNPAQITNALFNIWQVEGGNTNAPIIHNQPAVPQELIQRLDRLPQQARDQRGMSEMSMAARRPAGIEHKPGLKYLKDMENVRHTAEYRAWRRYKLDGYKNIIRCLSELSEHDKNFEVVFEKDKQLTRQKWSDINADSSRYRVKAKGTNLFARDPAQQAEQIADFVERGLLPPTAMYQIDAPDFQAMIEDKDVMRLNAIARVKAVIRGPEYDWELMPDPELDLETCKAEALKAKNKLELNGESPDKIDRVSRFLADVDYLLGIGAPQAPTGQIAGNQVMAADPMQGAAAALGTGMPAGPPGATVPPPILQ
jgi:hypothetical protein